MAYRYVMEADMSAEKRRKTKRSFSLSGKIAAWMCAGKRMRSGNRLNEEIVSISGGDRDAVLSYYTRKMRKLLIAGGITLAGASFLLIRFLTAGENSRIEEVFRPGYGKPGAREELIVSAGDEQRSISLEVGSREYTGEEAEALLDQAEEELKKGMLGENLSGDEVRRPLWFPKQLAGGVVKADWLTYPYGMISDEGMITGDPEEKGSLIEIQAVLSCQSAERIFQTSVMVFPPILSEEEQFWQEVDRAAASAEQKDPTAPSFHLPAAQGSTSLTWRADREQLPGAIILLLFVIPVFVYFREDQQVHETAQKRTLALQLYYSELLWKLEMLLGAGMTIRGAFNRIAASAGSAEMTGDRRFLYLELKKTCYEMKNGVSESAAYENFGRRCGLPCYIKLGTMLSQNLQKGSRGLVGILEKEAVSALEERKNAAKKMGEQAGTKILFPMIMMLGVVMAALIVPAFMNM